LEKVFVITSGKGGVGKTTITANLGCTLAKMGDKVCLIDADIGLKNLDVVLGLENRIIHTVVDVTTGRVKPEEALVRHKTLKSLYLLPASQIATKEMVSPEDMKRIVHELYPNFDYIIIDSPAGIERGFRNAVAAAETAIVVSTPDLPSISDADRVIGLLEGSGFDSEQIKLIVNRIKPKMVKRGEMLTKEDIVEVLAVQLLGLIPDTDEMVIATNRGIPVSLNGNEGVARTFENIARRLKGQPVNVEEDIPAEKLGFVEAFLRLFRRTRG